MHCEEPFIWEIVGDIFRTPETHPPTEKSEEISEMKLYKKAASQPIYGALNNPVSQHYLVFLGFLNFMFRDKSSEKT